MSSDSQPRKVLRRSLILGTALLLAGCQARPLYQDTEGQTRTTLASVAYSPATSRVEQETRNRLIFLTAGGAETSTPLYRVELSVSSSIQGVLLDRAADTPNAGRAVVSAKFTVKRISDDQILKDGRRQAVALFDYPRQEFANLRAVRDAENRAARELAELIYADLAMILSR